MLFALYAIIVFAFRQTVEWFKDLGRFIRLRLAGALKKTVVALFLLGVIVYHVQPTVQLYKYAEKAHRSGQGETLYKWLIHTEKQLLALNHQWKSWPIISLLQHVPILNRLQFSLGITAYHLGEAERLDYNKHIKQVFKDLIKSQKVRLVEKAGWLRPEVSSQKLTFRERALVGQWQQGVASFYFTPATSHELNNIRGIYLSGGSAREKQLKEHLSFVKQVKNNAVVFDIKDVTGFVNFPSKIQKVIKVQKGIQPPISNLSYTVASIRRAGVYSIARVALFQDERLVSVFPQYAIFKKNGQPLKTGGRSIWVDPNKTEVQQYNLALIREVLSSGVDEIQLDYVRYPAEGDWREGAYFGIKNHSEKPGVICGFLQKVHALTRSYGVPLSIDVFGVVAWQRKPDIKSTGQDMRLLSQATDVISPMLYPSHFGKVFGTIRNPADSPYRFIEEGCSRVKKIAPEGVHIRPWLQAFKWRVTNYNSSYIERQIAGAFATRSYGYLLWNAGNNYLSYREPTRSP